MSQRNISLRVNEGMPKKRPSREKRKRPPSTALVLRFYGRKIINISSNCPGTSIHVIPSSSHRVLKDSWNFQERTLNLRDFGRKVAPRSNPLIAARCRRSVGRMKETERWEGRDTGDGSAVGGVQPSLDFGILQRRRASLMPSESVGRYDVGDEGGRMGLRS